LGSIHTVNGRITSFLAAQPTNRILVPDKKKNCELICSTYCYEGTENEKNGILKYNYKKMIKQPFLLIRI
jgi:hypothetical protein